MRAARQPRRGRYKDTRKAGYGKQGLSHADEASSTAFDERAVPGLPDIKTEHSHVYNVMTPHGHHGRTNMLVTAVLRD